MYAQLCKRIEKELETDIDKTKSGTFLQILLNVCRDKFENRVHYSEKIINSELALTDDLEEKKNVAKQKILGNVKFIGELYKLDMLGEPHLHKMLRSLFTNKSGATTEKNCEDMECLAQLIKTCGKNLDTELGKQLMDQYFDRMEQYSLSSRFPPRIRFLLRDLIELRKNTWTPRKVARVEGPAPIQELTNEDDLVLRPPFGMRGRDYRNQERGDQRDWISKFSLNPLNFNDSFNLLSVSTPSPLIPSTYSPSPNGYGNRDHRDNGGGSGGGGGGNYRMHNDRNGRQNQHNSNYHGNGNNMRYNNNNKHGNHHGGRDGGGGGGQNHHHQNNSSGGGTNSHNSYSNRDGMMNSKDLAPRFKRNLMTPQNPVEDLQMRPTPNSLLFKTQNMNMKTQLPISQVPSSQSSKSSNFNSSQLGDFPSPLTTRTLLSEQRAAAGGNSAYGANVNHNGGNAGSYNQTPLSSNANYGAGSGANSSAGSNGNGLGNIGPTVPQNASNNPSPLSSQATPQSRSHLPSALNGKSQPNQNRNTSPVTPINNILQKDQVIIKQASSDKADKKNKKDKGPNKEEFLKKVSAFASDILLDNLKKQIEEDQQGKTNNKPVENEAIKEVVVEVIDKTLPNPYTVNEADLSEKSDDDKSSEKGDFGSETKKSDDEAEQHLMNDLVREFCMLRVPDKFMRDSVIKILNEVLDKPDSFHEKTIEFLQKLRKENKLNNGAMLEAFKTLINSMNEKEKTIPKITTIVASLLSRAVSVKLCKLSDISNYTDNGQHYPLFLLVLQQLHKQLGKQTLQEMFQSSKVNLMSSLPECDRTKDRMAEILEDRSLSFLYPLLRVQAELWKQIQADSNPQQFYKWIKENVEPSCYTDPGFITAVMTVLLKYIMQESSKYADEKQSVEKEMEILRKYCPVLNAFLNGNNDLQLIAIYAMQVYWYSINFPKGVLLRWFRECYELSVIEEEAFLRYKEDVTDMYPGKGKALFQVNQWLTWLAEAEDEDEEDEE
ncbi:eukaryotic translation initiation factor 4 gamma 2 [Toxorhynchites rutilus septentrionalis]|uniref:eukaryotic translation initiation factor 4 gamma 2 n=1 Tax=Toxorhynchites rutilus septentrionalis TaxID=329112 RepID=UPI002479E895|nr:eukaryotic translation initiation factor 4 gamma 2 [Toxorhynchites rutilus septentrionalis]